MSVRRQTANRLTLFRTCGTCGKQIVTTADTPWVRQVERDGGAPEAERPEPGPGEGAGAEPGIPAGTPGGAAGKGTAAPPGTPRTGRRRQRLRPAQAQAESGGGAG